MRRLATICIFLTAALAGRAQAQLAVRAELYRGLEDEAYSCLALSVDNNYSRDVNFRVSAQSVSGMRTRMTELPAAALRAGESRTFYYPLMGQSGYLNLTARDSAGGRIDTGAGPSPKAALCIDWQGQWPTEKEREDYTAAKGLATGSLKDAVLCREPTDLPESWLAYMPFSTIIVGEPAFRQMSQPARTALLERVRSGAQLVIHGTQGTDEPLLLGRIVHAAAHPIKNPGEEKFPLRPSWQRQYEAFDKSYLNGFPFAIVQAGGRVGGLLLATLFFVLAGPVNYLYFKRRGRIRMLLVSLPAISICFCLIIGAYFVLAQGFRRRGGTVSVTLLDESRAAAFTFAHHGILSGLYPLGGFRFPADAAFFSLAESTGNDGFRVETAAQTATLRSGLFKPTVMFNYATARPYDTREKLVFEPEGNVVVNGFESDLLDLYVVRGDQVLHAKRVAQGQRSALGPVELKEDPVSVLIGESLRQSRGKVQFVQRSFAETMLPHAHSGPGRYYYIARMARAPDAADPGVGMTRPGQLHFLVGLPKPAAPAGGAATPQGEAQ